MTDVRPDEASDDACLQPPGQAQADGARIVADQGPVANTPIEDAFDERLGIGKQSEPRHGARIPLSSPSRASSIEARIFPVVASSLRTIKFCTYAVLRVRRGPAKQISVSDHRSIVPKRNVVDSRLMALRALCFVLVAALVGCAGSRVDPVVGRRAASDVLNTLKEDGRFMTFTLLLKESGMTDELATSDAWTVFAPTDIALDNRPKGAFAGGLGDDNRTQLQAELRWYLVPRKVSATELKAQDSVETAAGRPIPIKVASDRLLIGNALVDREAVESEQVIIHVLDRVLLPPVIQDSRTQREGRKNRRVQPDQWYW